MGAKVTTVKMQCAAGVSELEIEHAERILQGGLVKPSGWELIDKDYEFKDGHINRRNKKEGSGEKGA